VTGLDDATRTQMANIERSTGRNFVDWVALVRDAGPM
jgi:hypothetical protein